MTKLKECADCKQIKPWIFKKKLATNKKYIDENGRYWVSAACPDCANERTKKSQKKRKIKQALGLSK